MAIVTVGIDLAKNVFAVHGVDETGKLALVRPEVPRAKLLELMDERIKQYDQYIEQAAKEDKQSRQLMQLSGIGATTASAIVATVGKGHDFTCGRQFCAWLGLVPGQYSSGGKQRLGRITKAGELADSLVDKTFVEHVVSCVTPNVEVRGCAAFAQSLSNAMLCLTLG